MTTTIIITTMDLTTRAYTQETPAALWQHFTDGPASDGYDRYGERITQLIAADVLAHCPDRLDEEERELAEMLVADLDVEALADVDGDGTDEVTADV